MSEEKIICVGCPMGCETTLHVDAQGRVIKIEGNKCKEGYRWVIEEYQNPVRIFTGTLLTQKISRPLLPVRSNRPILKTKMKEVARALVKIKVSPPIQAGQIILKNFLNSGSDIVATDELSN